MACDMPLRQTMCATCPFGPGSTVDGLAATLEERILTDSSHICHSTGANNAFNKRTGLKPHLCRGARDVQNEFMAAMRVIEAPTDEAWNKQRIALGMQPTKIVDPKKPTKRKKAKR